MPKILKQTAFGTLKISGAFRFVANSRWRRRRLLILAYHGISLDDEHLWDPGEYIPKELFRARLKLIKKSGCTVLPLAEAIERLYAGKLPPRSITITFDDGTHDFYKRAWPILKEFDFPVTLYLTTFYCDYNRPVFDVICSYLLWKSREVTINLRQITGQSIDLNLSDLRVRKAALKEIHRFVADQKYSAEEKDVLAATLAKQLKIDYEEVLKKRVLQLVSRQEVEQLAADGVDIQLHTHRHRVPLDRDLFMREIDDNRSSIEAMTGKRPTHFCYPSGIYHSLPARWLREAGIESAATCDPGLASPASDQMFLPRLLDGSGTTQLEFAGWLSGASVILPNGERTAHLAMNPTT